MELPTCPSCGQSVLDDDAKDCPFCGAAMDGSSPGRKPASKKEEKQPAPKKAETKAEPVDEDPFAIRQNPASVKAVQCARKPMKGRRQRVVCPMCDTQGFIPKAALGRQVKCANKECMVPVFAAKDPEAKAEAPTRGRISDEETPAPKTAAAVGKAKNPILMYGIVGGVLLLLTVGLMFYLDQDGVTELGPADIKMPTNIDDEEEVGNKNDKPTPKVDHRQVALDTINEMISAALANDNLDKPTSRRLIGDCYLRLGMPDKAQAEFDQMNVVAGRSRQNAEYYPIVPLISAYWRHLKRGEDAVAADLLKKANALAEKIPVASGFSIETSVALAAAMTNDGSAEDGLALITKQQRDQSLAAQKDAVSFGAWRAIAAASAELKQRSLPVLEVFSWNEPLVTATAVQLAIRGRWDAATQWAILAEQPETAADTMAAIAQQMLTAKAPDAARTALVSAAGSKGADVKLRVTAVLARENAANDAWAAATAELAAVAAGTPASLGNIVTVLQGSRPDVTASLRSASGVAEYIIAAVHRKDDAAAAGGFQKLGGLMFSIVPPSAEVRQTAGKFDSDSQKVQEEVATALSLTDPNRISSRFIAYRKAIDHIVRAAETRHMHLIRLLAHIIQNGGLNAVSTELQKQDSVLAKEVGVDRLQGLLYVAAAETGLDYSAALKADPNRTIRLARIPLTDQFHEYDVVPVLVKTVQNLKDKGITAVNELRQAPRLPGLRAAFASRLVEKSADDGSSPATVLQQVLDIEQDLWRKQAFSIAAEILADRGMSVQMTDAATNLPLTPDQRVQLLHATSRMAIDAARNDSAATDAPESQDTAAD